MVAKKEPVNLRRLKADLGAIAPNWVTFEARSRAVAETISQDTVARIINDGSATVASIGKIAKILGTDPAYYLGAGNASGRSVTNLSGEWTAFYLETWPPLYGVSTTKERLIIRQSGLWLSGTYEFLCNDDPELRRDTIFEMRGRIVGSFVTGFYFVRGRETEQGIGTFQLKVLDEGRYAEGFCTYCSDTDVVSVSANIWVKQRESTSLLYGKAAEKLAEYGQFFVRPEAR